MIKAVLAAILLLAVGAAYAQPADPAQPIPPGTPENLSLAEAKRLAIVRNWDLLASKSDVSIATAQRLISHEFPNPTLSLSTAKAPVNDQPASTRFGNGLWQRSYDTIVSVNQLFEIGGKRASRQRSAEHGIKAAKARYEDARRVLDLGVTKAYVMAVQLDLNAKTLRDSADSLRREADIAAARLAAGDISTADKTRIEVDAQRFLQDARAAESSARQQRITLENLIGTPHPSGNWVATDSLETLVAVPAASEGEAAPLPRRADLVAAEQNADKAEADLRLQRALRVPDPTVSAIYEHNPPDGNQTVGLGVSFPLPLWNHNRGAIEQAEAARQQAIVQVDKVRAQIAADIATAREAYREAAARRKNYVTEIQPKSAQILKIISFSYSKGGASLLDLLSAQRDDNDARIATIQASADAATAAATLKAAMSSMEANAK